MGTEASSFVANDVFSAKNLPGLIGGVGKGMELAGLAASTAGAYKKSSGEQQGYTFQSSLAKQNAHIAEMQGKDAIVRGQMSENVVRHRTAHLKGTQRASLAARGVELGEGSALNILTDTEFMGERDALIARDNSAKEVWGLQVQQSNFESNAQLLDWRAGQVSPMMDAAGTLLTGAGKVASSWYATRAKATATNEYGLVQEAVPGQYSLGNAAYG